MGRWAGGKEEGRRRGGGREGERGQSCHARSLVLFNAVCKGRLAISWAQHRWHARRSDRHRSLNFALGPGARVRTILAEGSFAAAIAAPIPRRQL